MPTFAICRTEKIKNWATLAKSVGHNLRTSADDRQHLDASAPEPMRVVAGDAGWLAPWKSQVKGMHLRGLAHGQAHTLAREFFLGMSPEWAEGKSKAEIDAWAEANIAWLNGTYSPGYDPATPRRRRERSVASNRDARTARRCAAELDQPLSAAMGNRLGGAVLSIQAVTA